MSYARLTFIGATTVSLLVSGCAGPAWLAHGELPTFSERPSIDQQDATKTDAGEMTAGSVKELGAASSPSNVLDAEEPMTHQHAAGDALSPSEIDEIVSHVPPPHQQFFRDQMLAMASRQQEPAFNPPSAPAASMSSLTYPGPVRQSLPEYSMPVSYPENQSIPELSLPAGVVPDVRSIAGSLAGPLRSRDDNVHPAQHRTYIGDTYVSPSTVASDAVPLARQAPVAEPAAEVVKEEEIEPGQWSHEIEQALASMNADLARPNLERDERRMLEIMRRLLFVVANQRDEAVASIDELEEDEREYWKHQFHGLLVSIDADGKHPTTRRAALALRNLRTAADHLANVSTLDVRNLNFCEEVLSYGEYRLFDSYTFRAKSEVVLYVEVDNFAAHPRSDSFETELHSSYEIIDDAGRRVANVVLPVDKQVSKNRRRDYFIAHLITMPTQIAAGSYRLRLTIEDVIGKKSNHASIDFRIK